MASLYNLSSTILKHTSPWLRIIRLPNLLTVPGDPLAGAVIAWAITGGAPSLAALLLPVGVALAFYAFGLLMNDIVDLPEDMHNRPDRPLVRGDISPKSAVTVLASTGAVGLLLAALAGQMVLAVAACLLLLVICYHTVFKEAGTERCVCMGLCRALNFLLGASVVGISWPLLVPAIGITVYITLVTRIAATEHRAGSVDLAYPVVFMPLCTFAVFIIMAAGFLSWTGIGAGGIVLVMMTCVTVFAVRTVTRPKVQAQDKQAAIGKLLRLLVWWQAAYIFASGIAYAWLIALTFVFVYPCHKYLSRRISPT